MPLTSSSRTKIASLSSPISTSVSGGDGEPWTPLLDATMRLRLQLYLKSFAHWRNEHARESRKLWENVTDKLVTEYSEATKEKVQIEQRQRDEAAERKKNGVELSPRYFEKNYDTGRAELQLMTP